uniref:Ubiquinol-cytochrome c reductase complex assembly factor 1 n=1 Tax=Fundulus heteroclitus TaxID=8078 RepID=A0A3Q2NTL6_FUNHE
MCFMVSYVFEQFDQRLVELIPGRFVPLQLSNVKETPQHSQEEVGAFTKLIEAMGFTAPLKYNKWKIKIAALRMYTCCVERINYDEFFDSNLPEVLAAHGWLFSCRMCLVRMRQEGREGKFMCRYIVHSMWEDVEQRSKIMGIDATHRKEAMKAMTETFYAAIFGYDEGILSDDCVLAAALWRNLFNRQCEDPQQLELMVEYVRKQVGLFLTGVLCLTETPLYSNLGYGDKSIVPFDQTKKM